ERGVAHGNLKLTNVFLTDGGVVKLTDFHALHVLPDHAEAELREQDVATDLRLLAATYHWLLTGRPPTADRTLTQPGGSGQLVPTLCSQLISAALSRKAGQGFADAAAMGDALTEVEEALRGMETMHAAVPFELRPRAGASWHELKPGRTGKRA